MPEPLDYQNPKRPEAVTRGDPTATTTSLDKDERYVLAYLRSDHVAAAHLGWLIARLLIAGIFISGFVNENRAVIFTGFGTLLVLDLYSAARQPRFSKSICSAVEKLETRIEELESAARAFQ